MNGAMRGLAGSVLGTAVAAAALAAAVPAPAFACGGQVPLLANSSGAGAAPPAAAQRSTPGGTARPTATWSAPAIDVSGPAAVAVPAGGTGSFGITVVNRGAGFRGGVQLRLSDAGEAGLPRTTMELAGSRGQVKTWTRLAEEGTAGSRWYGVIGLAFQPGETTSEFRVGVPVDARGARMRITARVVDSAGRLLGSTTVNATVVDATLRVRTTFPAELRRGGAYREFDVRVDNPSSRAYHAVTVSLALTALGAKPTPAAAGSLLGSDIGLEQFTGGRWQRLDVRPGCDPTYFAQLGRPLDLTAGGSATVHLRIRLADSPATVPHPAHYWVSAVEPGNLGSEGGVDGDLVIRPHRVVAPAPVNAAPVAAVETPAGAPTTAEPTTAEPTTAAATTAEPTTAAATNAAPTGLADSGAPIWPIALGGVLLVAAGGALAAVRLRRG